MYQSNDSRDKVTSSLLPKTSHDPKLHFLNIHSESISIFKIAYPLVITGLFHYIRSFVSLYFLGHLGGGGAPLAGGSLALAFANITGYSLYSGLAMGVESICSQAFGAKRYSFVRATIKKGIILLLITSLPVSLLWINIEKILVIFKQDKDLACEARIFLIYSVPDLIAQSFLQPLRVYLRTQSKTLSLSICTAIASVLHLPITFLLVTYLDLGFKGIPLSCVVSNFNLVLFLFLYISFLEEEEEKEISEKVVSEEDSIREWKKLLCLAIPSCVSVCLEWWCYEIMILLCGFLINPKSSVASMGILIQITSLVYIFPSSLSTGVSTRVGNELGSNNPNKARSAAIVGLGLSIVLGFIALTFTVSVRNTWATHFTKEQEIIDLTSMVLPIVGLCELGNCPQTTGCGVLRGSARPKIGANINLVAFYVVGMPLGWVMADWFGFGLKGLWFGMLAAQVSCVVGMMVATCMTNWEVEAARAKKLTAVDDGSGGDGEDVEIANGDK